ncbi:MAG: hypothetical protein ACOY94_23455 [Bacillota bacterium]
MAPIYSMAIVATLVAAAIWGTFGVVLAGTHRRLLWLIVLALPFSTLVNLLVKRPFLLGGGQAMGLPFATEGASPFLLGMLPHGRPHL